MIGKTLGQVIEDWKIELIYPINKTIRSDWNQDLKLMCPITLLETVRKIFLKVLVNRLSEILTENKILTVSQGQITQH